MGRKHPIPVHMRRNNFLWSIGAIASLPLLACNANDGQKTQTGQAFKVASGEGRAHGHIKLKGVNSNLMDMKVSGRDSQGGFSMFEQTSLSPGRGTPLHVHHYQDEHFYVLEGEYYFQVGDKFFRLHKGESIFLPRAVPHAWSQVAEAGKILVLFQPAGKLEEFFLTMSALDHEPSKEEVARIFSDHDMEVVGPPIKMG